MFSVLNSYQLDRAQMSRCAADASYKVAFVSLVAVAVAFCLLITDVFVDIDGLMRVKKDKDQLSKSESKSVQTEEEPNDKYNTEINYYEMDYNYRTKRSLETQNLLLQMRNSKMKNMLTHRLASLLDQLDLETTEANAKSTRIDNEQKEVTETQKEEIKQRTEDKDDALHSALHEILLLGLKGHMDFNEVYERFHSLTADFEKAKDTTPSLRTNTEPPKSEEISKTDYLSNERRLFDEILHCKRLQDDVAEDADKIHVETRREAETNKREETKRNHVPKIIIKTVIDIKSLANGKLKVDNDSDSKETVKGLVKLIYNGKSIKFTRIDDEEHTNPEINPKLDTEPIAENPKYIEIGDLLGRYSKRSKADYIKEYLKNFGKAEIKTKRLKRHIKIRYENDEITEKPKKKKEDDELFVEIETHFDGKGMKGDKKKKMISNLVEKIQKAIHSGSDKEGNKTNDTIKEKPEEKKKRRHIHVKKRVQNPLNRGEEEVLKNKIMLPYDAVVHRQLNPIDKVVPLHEPMPHVSDKHGQNWYKPYYGPGFLAVTKAINSAEMSQVDVDYKANEISPRMQKPLNNEISEKAPMPNAYDSGKLKFFVKDIEGSGFSVGFNQYVDEQPDPEAIKLFTGLENILQTYHQKYDQAVENELDSAETKNDNYGVNYEPNGHTIARRSVESDNDYHSNEYKVIFDNNFMPYENYEDILNENINVKKPTPIDNLNIVKSHLKSKIARFVVNDDVLEKKLKPAEIFGLADLLQRKKRSISVQKISNLKNKFKLNRYLNTKAMATKRIFLNKKRSKRQVDKVRIIARDDMPNTRRNSEEIFVVSDENVMADRAVVREVETPEMEPERVVEDHYDVISPMAPVPHMEPIPQMPYAYEDPMDQPMVTNVFDGRSRHNSLMSKYPHILLEELARSREEDFDNPLLYSKVIEQSPVEVPPETTTTPTPTISNIPPPKMEEIVKAITPQNAKTNYRVTVKILPKNISDLNSGFKEIHTSINKSYNRNGLLYSSLVNVSEISKIVKINKTNDVIPLTTTTQSPMISHFRKQQETMNHILRQHKHRIEEQLNHLHREKERLENLSMKNVSEFEEPKQPELFEVVVPSNPPKVLRLTRDEISKLAVASLINFNKETPAPTTTVTTPYTIEVDTERTQIINKMERNENMTNEILKKIDKNTEILQVFLQKLTDKIDTPNLMKKNEIAPDFDMRQFKMPVPFNKVMPNMEANGSHVAIPFIYAYQQPYELPVNKPQVPVASVVYHGHIHTNTINGKKDWPEKVKKDVKKDNQTRFFIDELENDYKVMPVGSKKPFRNNTRV